MVGSSISRERGLKPTNETTSRIIHYSHQIIKYLRWSRSRISITIRKRTISKASIVTLLEVHFSYSFENADSIFFIFASGSRSERMVSLFRWSFSLVKWVCDMMVVKLTCRSIFVTLKNFCLQIMILLTCIIAFFLNLSIYWIIGYTSPLTYNMVGHLKFCLTAGGGYLIFNEPLTSTQIIGVVLTLTGVTAYGQIKVGCDKTEPFHAFGESSELILNLTQGEVTFLLLGQPEWRLASKCCQHTYLHLPLIISYATIVPTVCWSRMCQYFRNPGTAADSGVLGPSFPTNFPPPPFPPLLICLQTGCREIWL